MVCENCNYFPCNPGNVLCVQVHEDHLKHVTVYWSGVDNTVHPASYEDDIEILPEDDSASSNGE